MEKKIVLFFVFLLCFIKGFSQTDKQIDSLYQVVEMTKNDSVRFISYNRIAFHYIFNDSEKALQILKKSQRLALKANSAYGYAKLINTHGIYMDVNGKSDSAEYYFNKALKISQKNKFYDLESFCINNLGMFYWNKGNFNKALAYFFKALKLSEKSGAKQEHIAINYNNIGLIYQQMNLFEKALVFHQKAYELRKRNNLRKEEATSLNNIGLCYKFLEKTNLAIPAFERALKVAEESKNFIDYYKILENMGDLYLSEGKYDESIKYYMLALGNENDKSRLFIYSGLTEAYNQKQMPETALEFAGKGLKLVNENPDFKNFSEKLYRSAAHSYYLKGNFKKGKEFTDDFIAIKDSVFSQNNANAIANLEVRYETEKKEHELAESRAIVAERELEIKNKNTQFLLLVIVLLAVLLISYLFYNQQKLKNRQLKKESLLKDAMAKIETQNHLQQQRLLISRDLHDNIGAQLTFIISSLDNLKFLELSKEKLNQKLHSISDFTIATIYELRDTIWAMNKNDITFDDLKTRITNFIDNAKSSKENIVFDFTIHQDLNRLQTFTSVDGMNIYRIIQESVNNALKYANAGLISVDICETDKILKISISDNGVGFNAENADFGNGLNNMKKRAKELGASIEIISSENNGTTIVLKKQLG